MQVKTLDGKTLQRNEISAFARNAIDSFNIGLGATPKAMTNEFDSRTFDRLENLSRSVAELSPEKIQNIESILHLANSHPKVFEDMLEENPGIGDDIAAYHFMSRHWHQAVEQARKTKSMDSGYSH